MPSVKQRCFTGDASITRGADVGCDRLPDPRRKQHEGRRDLAEVAHHRVRLFDEIDLHPAEQAFAEHVDLFHDPGQRQHRDIFVVGPLRVKGEIGRAVAQHAAGGQHGKFRMRCRAGGGAEDRDVLAFGCISELVVESWLARRAVAAHCRKPCCIHQPRIVIFSHAARIGIDDVLQVRHAVGKREQLVDLLLVFREDESRFAIVEKVGRLLIEHVAIETEAQTADRMGGDLGRDPVRTIIADDADHVAATEPQLHHAERELLHARLVVVPGEQPPQSQMFLTQGDLPAVFLRVKAQQFWIGVGLRDPGGVIHHAALSASLMSSGSTRTSSSSPR